VGVLASGEGTNLQALLEASRDPSWPAVVTAVACDVPGAPALTRAERAGTAARLIPSAGRDRTAFEEDVLAFLGPRGTHPVDLVCLAGFRRILTRRFLDAWSWGGRGLPSAARRLAPPAPRILNIHPSLLPAFPGLHALRDARAAGVAETGVTVHAVDEGVDTGPVLAQRAVPIVPGDTLETLRARVQAVEHVLYPAVVAQLAVAR
jgi:phosphoribosylglycinamide formyltransferase-1